MGEKKLLEIKILQNKPKKSMSSSIGPQGINIFFDGLTLKKLTIVVYFNPIYKYVVFFRLCLYR